MTQDTHTPEIVNVGYHRNGVSGMGFYIAVVRNPLPDHEGDFLCVSFDDERDFARENGEPSPGPVNPYFAALRVEDVASHNITMHPFEGFAGGAAYRGDVFDSALHTAIREEHRRRYDAWMATLIAERKAAQSTS